MSTGSRPSERVQKQIASAGKQVQGMNRHVRGFHSRSSQPSRPRLQTGRALGNDRRKMRAVLAAECANPCPNERGCRYRNEDCRCDIALNQTDTKFQSVEMLLSALASILEDRNGRIPKRYLRCPSSPTREPRLCARASHCPFRARRPRKILCKAFQPLPPRRPSAVRIHWSGRASKVDPFLAE